MAIGVQSDDHAGMTEALAYYLRGNSVFHHQRGVGVTQIVQTEPFIAKPSRQPPEGQRQSRRRPWRAVAMGKDKGVISQLQPQLACIGFLPLPMGAQLRSMSPPPFSVEELVAIRDEILARQQKLVEGELAQHPALPVPSDQP